MKTAELLNDEHFAVIDIETTGFSPRYHDIIEIAAIHWYRGEIKDSLVTLVKPDRNVPADAVRVHGIDEYMLKDAPPMGQVLSTLEEFLKGKIPVFHNAPFDKKFIDHYMVLHDREPLREPVIDTLKFARRLWPDLSHKLGSLSEHFGLVHENHHRAKGDARCTALLWNLILIEIKRKSEWEKVEDIIPGELLRTFEKFSRRV